jgi:hypothetical protein
VRLACQVDDGIEISSLSPGTITGSSARSAPSIGIELQVGLAGLGIRPVAEIAARISQMSDDLAVRVPARLS